MENQVLIDGNAKAKQVGPDDTDIRPTKFRWNLAFLMFFLTFMVYMDRVNLSVATPAIMKEFHFTKMHMGYVQTAFFLGYALMQVPGGIFTELFGHRKVVPAAVTLWSVFTVLTAYCGNFVWFLIVRFLFGFGEGPIYPAFNNFAMQWFNRSERAKANAFLLGGTFFGPVVGPAATVSLMVAFGWRSVFIVFGLVGIVAAMSWYWLATDSPRTSSRINAAELKHIQGPERVDDKKEVAPWSSFIGSTQFWAIAIQYFIADYIMYVFLAWLPLYLMEVNHFSLQKMGFAAALPWLAICTMVFVTGFISDRLVARGVSKYKARTYFGILGLVLCCGALYLAAVAKSPVWNVLWMTVSLGSLGFTFNASWTSCNDLGGKFSASVSGWMNLFGNAGGILAPTVTAWLATQYGWQVAIMVTAATTLIGVVAWFAVKPDVPLRLNRPADRVSV
jgi:ACS family glucarate transporter-like MFS transporter